MTEIRRVYVKAWRDPDSGIVLDELNKDGEIIPTLVFPRPEDIVDDVAAATGQAIADQIEAAATGTPNEEYDGGIYQAAEIARRFAQDGAGDEREPCGCDGTQHYLSPQCPRNGIWEDHEDQPHD